MKYQISTCTDIKPLIQISIDEAKLQNIQISEIEISQHFYELFSDYLSEHNLYTYVNYGKAGREHNGDFLTYTCFFRLKHYRGYTDKYYISNHSSTAYLGNDMSLTASLLFDTTAPPEDHKSERLKYCEENTPTLLELFYEMVKDYRNDILHVEWYIAPTSSGNVNCMNQ